MPSLRQCHEVGWQAVSAWALAPSARVSSSGLVKEDGLIRACGEEAATRGSTRRRVPRMQATEPPGQRITSRSRFSMTNPDCAGDALVSRTPNSQRHAGIASCLQPPPANTTGSQGASQHPVQWLSGRAFLASRHHRGQCRLYSQPPVLPPDPASRLSLVVAWQGRNAGRGPDRTGPTCAQFGERTLYDQANSVSNAPTLRVRVSNSTPTRWMGSPRWRYLAA